MADLTPIEPELATSEDAAAQDAWVCTKAAPRIRHDSAMAEMRALIKRAQRK